MGSIMETLFALERQIAHLEKIKKSHIIMDTIDGINTDSIEATITRLASHISAIKEIDDAVAMGAETFSSDKSTKLRGSISKIPDGEDMKNIEDRLISEAEVAINEVDGIVEGVIGDINEILSVSPILNIVKKENYRDTIGISYGQIFDESKDGLEDLMESVEGRKIGSYILPIVNRHSEVKSDDPYMPDIINYKSGLTPLQTLYALEKLHPTLNDNRGTNYLDRSLANSIKSLEEALPQALQKYQSIIKYNKYLTAGDIDGALGEADRMADNSSNIENFSSFFKLYKDIAAMNPDTHNTHEQLANENIDLFMDSFSGSSKNRGNGYDNDLKALDYLSKALYQVHAYELHEQVDIDIKTVLYKKLIDQDKEGYLIFQLATKVINGYPDVIEADEKMGADLMILAALDGSNDAAYQMTRKKYQPSDLLTKVYPDKDTLKDLLSDPGAAEVKTTEGIVKEMGKVTKNLKSPTR